MAYCKGTGKLVTSHDAANSASCHYCGKGQLLHAVTQTSYFDHYLGKMIYLGTGYIPAHNA